MKAMKKKKISSQGEIIDQVRRVRLKVWKEYSSNRKKFDYETRKIINQLGLKYRTPGSTKKKKAA